MHLESYVFIPYDLWNRNWTFWTNFWPFGQSKARLICQCWLSLFMIFSWSMLFHEGSSFYDVSSFSFSADRQTQPSKRVTLNYSADQKKIFVCCAPTNPPKLALPNFYTLPHKKWRGFMLYPLKILSICPSVRTDVRPSISTSFPDSNLT